MRRALSSVAAACAFLAVVATPSLAASSQCRTADYAMQCVKVANSTPGTLLAARAVSFRRRGKAHSASVFAFGIDFGWRTVGPRTTWTMGGRFAASYLSTDASKNWTRAMLGSYHARGIATVCVWETRATRALGGYAAGQADARSALRQEQALGVPASKPIYFAVDFNETPRQAGAVASYFRGVNTVLGVNRTGGYGGYWTVSRLFNAGLIHFGWQTSAWSGGRWDPRAQLQQYAYQNAFDWDRAMAVDFGGTY